MGFKDHFTMFGDSIQQMAAGRKFLLPEWGTWIPARIVGDFFAYFFFLAYFELIAPLFGVVHVVDAYSVFCAVLYGLIFVSLSFASFQYSKLFIYLEAKHFFIYSIVFFTLFMVKFGQSNLTLMMAYDVPIVLGIWFVYPFVAYMATRNDPLKNYGDVGPLAIITVLGYLVSFSATNVEIFVVLVLFFSTILLFFTQEDKFSIRITSLLKTFKSTPNWFLLGVIYIPTCTVISILFDINGGRYLAEKNKKWGSPANDDMSVFNAIEHLNLGYETPLSYFIVLAFVLVLIRVVISGKKQIVLYSERIVVMSVIILSLIFYFIFLLQLTEFGSRNYFAHSGFSAFFLFFICLISITLLFSFHNQLVSSMILIPIILIISLYGMKQMINPPSNENISAIEMKNVFNSMYISYCFDSDKVPVYLVNPRYPYVPIPDKYSKNWFGQSFSKVFSNSVIKKGNIQYLPTYYAVGSVDELYSELDRLSNDGRNRCLDLVNSPYYMKSIRQ